MGNGPFEMYFPLKMGYSIAMLVYQRVYTLVVSQSHDIRGKWKKGLSKLKNWTMNEPILNGLHCAKGRNTQFKKKQWHPIYESRCKESNKLHGSNGASTICQHDITNPKKTHFIGEIPQSYRAFGLFDPPKMVNLMTPVCTTFPKNIYSSTLQWTTTSDCGPICLEVASFCGRFT